MHQPKAPRTVALLTDFNAANLAACLENGPEEPAVKVIQAPYGQVRQVLLDPQAELWHAGADDLFVWTLPEAAAPSLAEVGAAGGRVPADRLESEVDRFCGLIERAAEHFKSVFVAGWLPARPDRGLGPLERHPGWGRAHALARINLRLDENLGRLPSAWVLDSQRWLLPAGERSYDSRLWYSAKTPFSKRVFQEAARDLKSALAGLLGASRKLIILDLDNTLWGGIVGDEGWENLRLGGHDPIGEAFADFQRSLKELAQRGILLGVASKNEEEVALEAIAKHPEMVLSADDLAGWRIDWEDKARNVASLVDELNLGLQSVVFIDDNPVERARVAEALPEVLVPDWPGNPMAYRGALDRLRCFDRPSLSGEDRARTGMYVSERKRRQAKREVGSLEDWLQSLAIGLKVEALGDENVERVVQLLNKTNQMNLSTRRMTRQELVDWAGRPDNRLWAFRVSDKFGDSGLSGIASLTLKGAAARLRDFILSCRVMGRQVEDAMLAVAAREARAEGAGELVARYRRTAKNKPCLRFLRQSVMEDRGEGLFALPLDRDYQVPSFIEVEAASPEMSDAL